MSLNPFGFRAGFRTSQLCQVFARLDVLIPLVSGLGSGRRRLRELRWYRRLNPFGFRAGFRTPGNFEDQIMRVVLIPLVSGLGSGLEVIEESSPSMGS